MRLAVRRSTSRRSWMGETHRRPIPKTRQANGRFPICLGGTLTTRSQTRTAPCAPSPSSASVSDLRRVGDGTSTYATSRMAFAAGSGGRRGRLRTLGVALDLHYRLPAGTPAEGETKILALRSTRCPLGVHVTHPGPEGRQDVCDRCYQFVAVGAAAVATNPHVSAGLLNDLARHVDE